MAPKRKYLKFSLNNRKIKKLYEPRSTEFSQWYNDKLSTVEKVTELSLGDSFPPLAVPLSEFFLPKGSNATLEWESESDYDSEQWMHPQHQLKDYLIRLVPNQVVSDESKAIIEEKLEQRSKLNQEYKAKLKQNDKEFSRTWKKYVVKPITNHLIDHPLELE
jgi:hypothetical protein